MGRNWSQVLQDRNDGKVAGFGPEADKPLDELSRDELRDRADAVGIDYSSKTTKADLVAALEAQ